MMHRNLDRRVEALVKIVQPDHIQQLEKILNLGMSDEISSWHLQLDGTWVRHSVGPNGEQLAGLQEQMMLYAQAKRNSR